MGNCKIDRVGRCVFVNLGVLGSDFAPLEKDSCRSSGSRERSVIYSKALDITLDNKSIVPPSTP